MYIDEFIKKSIVGISNEDSKVVKDIYTKYNPRLAHANMDKTSWDYATMRIQLEITTNIKNLQAELINRTRHMDIN